MKSADPKAVSGRRRRRGAGGALQWPYGQKVSESGFYLTTEAIGLLPKEGRFRARLSADWGSQVRQFAPVRVAGEDFIADAITGTLYAADGSSVSGSPMRVLLRGMKV